MKGLILTIFGILIMQYSHAQSSMKPPIAKFPVSVSTIKSNEKLLLKPEVMVMYTPNVIYTKRDNLDLSLQILSPNLSDKKKLPCVIYVQGSAWMKQDVYKVIPQLSKFAQRGFLVAIVEYRPSAVSPFPAQIQDAKTAIRFMRKNAEKYNIDPENIFIWGDSSGGHTSVFAGVSSGNKVLDTEEYAEYSDKVNAVVDFYGPTDIAKMQDFPSSFNHNTPDSPEGMLIGGFTVNENPEKSQKTNPLNYINKTSAIPPILIAHGDMDRIVPFNQSELLAKKLQENEKVFEYYTLAGADHGTAEFWTVNMFNVVETFIRKNTKK
jgi:acetyl esterase/lipase